MFAVSKVPLASGLVVAKCHGSAHPSAAAGHKDIGSERAIAKYSENGMIGRNKGGKG